MEDLVNDLAHVMFLENVAVSAAKNRTVTNSHALFHPAGNHGQTGLHAALLAMVVRGVAQEAALEIPALEKELIPNHATHSSVRRWNRGANGPTATALQTDRSEPDTVLVQILDQNAQIIMKNSETAFAQLELHVRNHIS